ncbi:DoxX family protein [Microtetraspora sp. NBRC 16547]|uniref:DoxX family protein n=1 Tax=Microtetraspora sp. NBRC 16547 TaxID=3030993 RepID=UPI0024A57BCD|nr:DoxX family protein [Microtetraspora sp. NBRC 16547]GLX00718.1 membrane protein [Microtetraspora sp. NBRC 16547]
MKRALYAVAALVGRSVLGIIFITHGWEKYGNGVDATAAMFAEAGVPLPRVSAVFAIVAELGGGSLLILGLLTSLAGIAVGMVAAGAFLYVHVPHGAGDGGLELVLALGALALVIAVAGPGWLSLDHLLVPRILGRRRQEAVPASV